MLRSLLSLAVSAAATEEVGYELLVTSAPEEFTDRCVKVAKHFPSWAEGDFIISSTGLLDFGEGKKHRTFGGVLDSFGKLHKYTMKGDQVCATFRMMGTGFYNKSKELGTIAPGLLFYETDPPRSCGLNPLCNLLGPNDNSYVVTFEAEDGVIYSTTDSSTMVAVDRESLNVTADVKVGIETSSKLQVSFLASAHPVRHPSGRYVDFIGSENPALPFGKIDIKAYEMAGNPGVPENRKLLNEFNMDKAPYMHSFGITDNYLIFPHMPVEYDMKAVFGKTMAGALKDIPIHTDDSPNNAFHVVAMDGKSPVKVYPLPKSHLLYYVHTINAFENSSGLVLDITTIDVNPWVQSSLVTVEGQKNKAARDATYDHVIVVTRFLIPHTEGGKVTSELMSDPKRKTEFTKANDNWARKPYCFYWANTWFSDYKNYGSMAVVKYDMCKKKYVGEWKRPSWYPSEPFVIPSSDPEAAEDDGLLVFTATDGNTKTSSYIVLNAKTMEEVSEAKGFPHIPYSAHGNFYPAKQLPVSTQYV